MSWWAEENTISRADKRQKKLDQIFRTQVVELWGIVLLARIKIDTVINHAALKDYKTGYQRYNHEQEGRKDKHKYYLCVRQPVL
jgi:hypothetical protein